jgi:hypothetical protein
VYECWEWALAQVSLRPTGWTNGLISLIRDVVADAKWAAETEAKGKAEAEAVSNLDYDGESESSEDDSESEWESCGHLIAESSGVEKTAESDSKADAKAEALPLVGVVNRPPRDVGVYTYLSSPWNLLIRLRYRL